MFFREGRWEVPWFINIVLVNPETGDLVKKQLDFRIDVGSDVPASWATLAAKVFEKTLPDMIKMAAEKEKNQHA